MRGTELLPWLMCHEPSPPTDRSPAGYSQDMPGVVTGGLVGARIPDLPRPPASVLGDRGDPNDSRVVDVRVSIDDHVDIGRDARMETIPRQTAGATRQRATTLCLCAPTSRCQADVPVCGLPQEHGQDLRVFPARVRQEGSA